MTPHLPGAAETRLDLVDDDQATGLAHQLHGTLQQGRRNAREPLVGEDRAEDHSGDADAGFLQAVDGGLDFAQVGLDEVLAAEPAERPVGLGEGDAAHFGEILALAVHQRRDLVHRGGVAVVGEVAADDAAAAPEHAGDA
ncbi:hypothetical protein D3C76_1310800 [compost metagenome]